MSVLLRLSAADEASIDPRAVRARLDWGAIAFVRCDLDVPRPLLEHVLKCLLARGDLYMILVIYSYYKIHTVYTCISYIKAEFYRMSTFHGSF